MYKNKASVNDLSIVIIIYFDITIPLDNFETVEWWAHQIITRNKINYKSWGISHELKFLEWPLTSDDQCASRSFK